ncbi:MAG: Fe(2+)-trafficking protein [Myxococcales bacterium]|nr:Fe(2+)-trafficking protein [Myxococcales bacterium]
MATEIQCVKCGLTRAALAKPPFRAGSKLGPLGAELVEKVCASCYNDWIAMSVKLVNEMRLDTTDPRGQELWLKQMKLFLNLEQSGDPWARFLNQRVALETLAGVQTHATMIGISETELRFAEFAGGAVPSGFRALETQGAASIARDAIKTLESA